PAICNTIITIAKALPTLPNRDTNVYTMLINTIETSTDSNINNSLLSIAAPKINISPSDTMIDCITPIIMNIKLFPTNVCLNEYLFLISGFLMSVVNKLDNSKTPTQIAKDV